MSNQLNKAYAARLDAIDAEFGMHTPTLAALQVGWAEDELIAIDPHGKAPFTRRIVAWQKRLIAEREVEVRERSGRCPS